LRRKKVIEMAKRKVVKFCENDKVIGEIEKGFKNVEQIIFGKKIISKKKLTFNSPVDWG
jgi:hypothetical protein